MFLWKRRGEINYYGLIPKKHQQRKISPPTNFYIITASKSISRTAERVKNYRPKGLQTPEKKNTLVARLDHAMIRHATR